MVARGSGGRDDSLGGKTLFVGLASGIDGSVDAGSPPAGDVVRLATRDAEGGNDAGRSSAGDKLGAGIAAADTLARVGSAWLCATTGIGLEITLGKLRNNPTSAVRRNGVAGVCTGGLLMALGGDGTTADGGTRLGATAATTGGRLCGE